MTKKLRITVEGKAYDVTVEVLDAGTAAAPVAQASAPVAAAPAAAAPAPAPAAPAAPAAAGAGDVTSPLAGKVDSIEVKIGQSVAEGEKIVTLEAMKMKTYIEATHAGTVKAILVNPGDSVEEGQALVTIG